MQFHLRAVMVVLWLLVAAFGGGCAWLPDPFIAHNDEPPRGNANAGDERPSPYHSDVARASFDNGALDVIDAEEARQREQLGLSDLAPNKLGKTYKKLIGQGPKRSVAQKLYVEADGLYATAVNLRSQGREHGEAFEKAAERYAAAAERWPDSSLEQDALFRVGECYFFADKYPDANEAFEQLIKKYPNTDYLDRAEAMRFSLAKFWLELDKANPQSYFAYNFTDGRRPARGTFSRAVKVFDRIRLDDPTGKLADDATLAAGNAHFERGDFIQAVDFYDDLRQTFPSSEHQFHAHFLGLKAKLETYPGKEYDGKTLDEAEELLKQIRKQFPREAEQEREFLTKTAIEIRYRKAERAWKSARYYDWRGEYRAARFYYDLIVQDYADTPFAQRARKNLFAIRDKPDVPPQRLSWLVKLFPDRHDAQSTIPTMPADVDP